MLRTSHGTGAHVDQHHVVVYSHSVYNNVFMSHARVMSLTGIH